MVLSDSAASAIGKDQEPTYHEAMDAHAREYLTRVLRKTGGDRGRAAQIAGLNRTHLQALIKRHNVDVKPDFKFRGRRKKNQSIDESEVSSGEVSNEEPTQARKAKSPRSDIRW